MASIMYGFPKFFTLPQELRDMIWAYAFPEARIYEVLDSPCPSQSQSGASAKLMFADVRNEPPPALARVCRDARQAVLRYYKPLAFSGVVKHINLNRDILLLDSYLQVRRLLKVIRLLSQVESVRRNASRLALGTSWGIHTGLHLRLFHKAVRTRQNMTRLLQYLSKFKKIEAIILVVHQRTVFSLRRQHSNHITDPWDHYDLSEVYYYRFNVNFNLENYWLRRPHETKLVQYNYEGQETKSLQCDEERYGVEKTPFLRNAKPPYRDTHLRGRQVRELKRMFEKSLHNVAGNDRVFPAHWYEPPKLETATLTWIYMGSAYRECPWQ
ncbi:hypothetical protein F5Y08DRAFT_170406 [Xylaria arbuscula]|nr:hypothetical protein F5Y08DRAFT_170406 [Xylaria arbuscula]